MIRRSIKHTCSIITAVKSFAFFKKCKGSLNSMCGSNIIDYQCSHKTDTFIVNSTSIDRRSGGRRRAVDDSVNIGDGEDTSFAIQLAFHPFFIDVPQQLDDLPRRERQFTRVLSAEQI